MEQARNLGFNWNGNAAAREIKRPMLTKSLLCVNCSQASSPDRGVHASQSTDPVTL